MFVRLYDKGVSYVCTGQIRWPDTGNARGRPLGIARGTHGQAGGDVPPGGHDGLRGLPCGAGPVCGRWPCARRSQSKAIAPCGPDWRQGPGRPCGMMVPSRDQGCDASRPAPSRLHCTTAAVVRSDRLLVFRSVPMSINPPAPAGRFVLPPAASGRGGRPHHRRLPLHGFMAAVYAARTPACWSTRPSSPWPGSRPTWPAAALAVEASNMRGGRPRVPGPSRRSICAW
jgi:hypothetical protein